MGINVTKLLGLNTFTPARQVGEGGNNGVRAVSQGVTNPIAHTDGLANRIAQINGELSPETRNDVLGRNVYFLA